MARVPNPEPHRHRFVPAGRCETLTPRRCRAAAEKIGALPPETLMFVDNGMQLFTDTQNSAALANAAGGSKTLVRYL